MTGNTEIKDRGHRDQRQVTQRSKTGNTERNTEMKDRQHRYQRQATQ